MGDVRGMKVEEVEEGEKKKKNNLVLYVCVEYNILKTANVTTEL